MHPPKLAVQADDLSDDIKRALNRARVLGFGAVAIDATDGPISPDELGRTGQRHFQRFLSDLGLRPASLRGPAAGRSYADATFGEQRLEKMRSIIRLAGSLGIPVVSTSPGYAINQDEKANFADRMRDAMATLADDADRNGVHVAIETTGVSSDWLGGVVRDIDCPFLGVCCDSGGMIERGDDPHAVSSFFPGRIHLVRGRDARPGSPSATGAECPVGEGALDVSKFLAELLAAGFGGDIVLSREAGDRRESDLVKGREIFAGKLGMMRLE